MALEWLKNKRAETFDRRAAMTPMQARLCAAVDHILRDEEFIPAAWRTTARAFAGQIEGKISSIPDETLIGGVLALIELAETALSAADPVEVARVKGSRLEAINADNRR